jgi:hypothetical protein
LRIVTSDGIASAEFIVLHPGPHRRILLGTHTTVGGDSASDLRLVDPLVSPRHAQVTRTGQDWTLRSCDDDRLCRVNDRPTTQCVLVDRDVIQFGSTFVGFRRLPRAFAGGESSPVTASLAALREDVAEQRTGLAEERGLWEAELERRRQSLIEREAAFRERAARTARAVESRRERNRRQETRLERRAAELERAAKKLTEARRALDFERQEVRVRERHLDEQFAKTEARRAELEQAEAEFVRTHTARQAELYALNVEIEKRRAEFDALVRAPANAPAGVALAYREWIVEAREREANDVESEFEALAGMLDDLLARFERHALVAENGGYGARRRPLSPPVVQDRAALDRPIRTTADVSAWADRFAERKRTMDWWSALLEDWRRETRAWRLEKTALFAELHREKSRVEALRRHLTMREARFARETAREREASYREREAVERRRAWIDRGQQRFATLQAKALQLRLSSVAARPDVADALQRFGEIAEAWQQFRCDVLRERLELACERERWSLKDRELTRLRRIVHKQRALLASLVADRRLAEQLWRIERHRREAAAEEREAAVENLAHALATNDEPIAAAEESADVLPMPSVAAARRAA